VTFPQPSRSSVMIMVGLAGMSQERRREWQKHNQYEPRRWWIKGGLRWLSAFWKQGLVGGANATKDHRVSRGTVEAVDARRQHSLWAIAIENYQAAKLTALHGMHNVSVGRSYYAVYTAMWVAVDEPPSGQWSHAGILQHFAPGRWRQPAAPIERALTRAIRRLYNARLRADYSGDRLTPCDSATGLETAREILILVAHTLGLTVGGITS
jgi:hypothetical protein